MTCVTVHYHGYLAVAVVVAVAVTVHQTAGHVLHPAVDLHHDHQVLQAVQVQQVHRAVVPSQNPNLSLNHHHHLLKSHARVQNLMNQRHHRAGSQG
jgi:hypothetical protein